jgi:hypothetical protein
MRALVALYGFPQVFPGQSRFTTMPTRLPSLCALRRLPRGPGIAARNSIGTMRSPFFPILSRQRYQIVNAVLRLARRVRFFTGSRAPDPLEFQLKCAAACLESTVQRRHRPGRKECSPGVGARAARRFSGGVRKRCMIGSEAGDGKRGSPSCGPPRRHRRTPA